MNYTHQDLVALGAEWLNKKCAKRCPVVVTEMATCASLERADIIGFNSVVSILIEVKVSRSDFLNDRKKPFREHPFLGMGDFRFYLSPAGIIEPADLPEKWGLLWVGENAKIKVAKSLFIGNGDPATENRFIEKNSNAERAVLYSALRRITQNTGD